MSHDAHLIDTSYEWYTESLPVIAALPGVLASGSQFKPLRPYLKPHASCRVVTEFGRGVDLSTYVSSVADVLLDAERDGRMTSRPMFLIGASLGGDRTPFVVDHLLRQYPAFRWTRDLHILIVDAPWGADTLLGVPPFAKRFAKRLAHVELPKMELPGPLRQPPKPEFITVPPPAVRAALVGHSVDEAGWQQYVIDQAKRDLAGHDMQTFLRQFGWMATVGGNGSLASAAERLKGLDVTYLTCTEGNDVVKQPLAQSLWEPCVKQIISVKGSHCGFLQNLREFGPPIQQWVTSHL